MALAIQHKSIGATALLLLTLFGVSRAASLIAQDWQFTGARTEVSFWGRGDYQPSFKAVRNTGLVLDRLLQASPAQPAYLSVRANSFAWRAYWSQDPKLELELAQEAVRHQRAALQSRPAHLQSKTKLIEYESRLESLNN